MNSLYNNLFLFLILIYLKLCYSLLEIDNKINMYFGSESMKAFENAWQKHRLPFENVIKKTLIETFGAPGGTMNVYVKHDRNPQVLTKGLYFNDNVNSVLLRNLYLREYPRLLWPDVSFPLHHNVLRIESPLGKLFADAEYVLFRNHSEVVFAGPQDPLQNSPFSVQQVQPVGLVTIIGEDCHLSGQAVVTMVGVSLHIGYSTFKLTDCKFSIEISPTELSIAPIIAPYFSKEQAHEIKFLGHVFSEKGMKSDMERVKAIEDMPTPKDKKELERFLGVEKILSVPIGEELVSLLEGVLISNVNTTSLFNDNMPKFRRRQKNMFQDVYDFMSQVTKNLNEDTLKSRESVAIKGMMLSYDTQLNGKTEKVTATIEISDVTVNGFERLYYSRNGGPVFTGQPQILDDLRLSKLQVQGKFNFNNGTDKVVYPFGIEIQEVNVGIKLKIGSNNKQKSTFNESKPNENDEVLNTQYTNEDSSAQVARTRLGVKFTVKKWNTMEFTSIDEHVYVPGYNCPSYAFIAGHINNELPKIIVSRLQKSYDSNASDLEQLRLPHQNIKQGLQNVANNWVYKPIQNIISTF